MSQEASIEMSDAPTGDAGTPTGVTAANLVSLWQENAVGFRCERTINWARRRAQSVSLLNDVDWAAPKSDTRKSDALGRQFCRPLFPCEDDMGKVGNSYMTRALKANDRRYAKILDRLGYQAKDEDVAAVRAEYQAKFGKRPFMGWGIKKMRQKMAEADFEGVVETAKAEE
jgi:hypothetical protein